MEKLTIEDINKVRDCAGTPVREPERSELKHIYSKLEFICQKLPKDKFNYKIRKDPRSQGGGFKNFQNYLWAKIFPFEFQNQVWDKLALIIGIANGTLHFHIMGIGEYQNEEASQKIHENSWTELNLDNLDYDFIVQEFENFYEENRNSFIYAAAELGIVFFKDLVKKMEIIEKKRLLKYKKQIILQGPPGTGKTREAKLIAKEILGFDSINDLENNSQFKLIQFHPSYTYEDFVRGIVAKPNEEGDGILYDADNKTLGNFAKIALDNYLDSKQENNKIENKPVFDAFIEFIKEEIAQNDLHKYNITDAVYLFSADETRFKYKGDNWVAHNKGLNMKFSELKKIIDSNATERQDIKKMSDLEELTRQHATYFIKLVEKFYEFEKSYELKIPNTKQVELKNYVLIIDEINRANLSSVLGELIYALEYRGEVVESMNEVDGSQKLILPPNLYIIGTMNTADRSVGHIDYAIRRRFAFVNVLPEKLSETDEIYFNTIGYEAVEKLFTSGLVSNEFDVKDVQIGHSYFIAKKEEATNELKRDAVFKMKMDFEIKPILKEYLKDGIFVDGKQIDGKDIKMYIEDLA